MSQEEAKNLLSQLIELLSVDGEAHQQELELLIGIGKLMGVNKEELLELFKNPTSFVAPKSEFDRILQFHRLVLMINVDEMITSQELDLIRKQGLAMGLRHEQINSVLTEMRKHENNMIPPERMIELFKTYNN